jgi:large subunit ribosomal protein L33
MAAGNRIIIQFECQLCKRRNYSSTKNKRTTPEKIVLKKFCRTCRKHADHKETK